MVCGQNYHGGDIQNGCGHRFNWLQAEMYRANAGKKPTQAEIDILPPEKVSISTTAIIYYYQLVYNC